MISVSQKTHTGCGRPQPPSQSPARPAHTRPLVSEPPYSAAQLTAACVSRPVQTYGSKVINQAESALQKFGSCMKFLESKKTLAQNLVLAVEKERWRVLGGNRESKARRIFIQRSNIAKFVCDKSSLNNNTKRPQKRKPQ